MNVQEQLYAGVTFELTDHFAGEQEVNTFELLATNPGLQQELHARGKGSLNPNTVDIVEEKDAGLAAQYKTQAEHLWEKVPSLETILGPGPEKRTTPQGWDASKKHISLCFATNCPLSRGPIVSSETNLEFFANASNSMLAIDPHIFENRFNWSRYHDQISQLLQEVGSDTPLERRRRGPTQRDSSQTRLTVKVMPPSQLCIAVPMLLSSMPSGAPGS
ncbi:GMC oxidoreductase [Suillus brevipes Sb2]|nr:GMC oxidoreductase [Suillus brevipes Sb2]